MIYFEYMRSYEFSRVNSLYGEVVAVRVNLNNFLRSFEERPLGAAPVIGRLMGDQRHILFKLGGVLKVAEVTEVEDGLQRGDRVMAWPKADSYRFKKKSVH